MKERKNVYKLPKGDTTLQWYASAVAEMKKRDTTDPTSWNYQGAIHGFDATSPFWAGAGPLPSPTEQNEFWKQCQHGTWYFLPWHRMYLAYFEQIVAKVIVDLGGPADWALPFWDYSDIKNPDALNIPPAFTSPAAEANTLWMNGRKSNVLQERYVSLFPLDTVPYTGDGVTAPLGFGGPQTTFSHGGGSPHGELEANIHDMVHVMIGGAMGNPRTAGLDPIFWLHHANIDRLWQVWINKGHRYNPTKAAWQDFEFNFHDQSGTRVQMKPEQVEDTRKVLTGYTYQDVPPGAPEMLMERGVAKKVDFSIPLDVVAATNKNVELDSHEKVVRLNLLATRRDRTARKLFNQESESPKTTILHFENITGKGVPPIHDVYLSAPEQAGKEENYYAGSLSFFGVEEASIPSVHHSGSGQHYALDISGLMTQLRSLPEWTEQALEVSIEPTEKMEEGAYVNIGRISLYSE